MKYKVSIGTKIIPSKLEKGSGILVLEPDDYSTDQINAIKAKGYKVLGYLSVGTIEKERKWWKDYSDYRLKRLEDWPKEYYVNVCKTQWQYFIAKRARELKEKGFAGWWLDNVDVYSEYKSKSIFTALAAIFLKCRAIGGYIMVNGGSEWIDDAIDRGEKISKYIDGYTQEEVFSRIIDYDGKGKFSKQKTADRKYYKNLILKVKKKKVHCFLLEYTKDATIKRNIKEWCTKNKVNYYISESVQL